MIVVFTLLLVASCARGEQEADAPARARYIEVICQIEGALTKAPVEDQDAQLSDISFLHARVSAAADPVSFAGKTPIPASGAEGGRIIFASGQEPEYDDQTAQISYLMAYHPTPTTSQNDRVSWAVDGTVDPLVSNLWNAGTYMYPSTNGLTFKHILSRIEVKCRFTDPSHAPLIKQSWGQLTGIQFRDAATTIEFDYATNQVTPGPDVSALDFLNGASYIRGPFIPIDIPQAGESVVASAMLPPVAQNTFTLLVHTARQAPTPVTITLQEGNLSPGNIHTITLDFNAKNKTIQASATTIHPWNSGGQGANQVLTPTVLTFGKAPYELTSSLIASTMLPYGDLFGTNSDQTTGSNGTSYPVLINAYANEPPYYKFEIARQDISLPDNSLIQWNIAQGVAANKKHGDICATTLGDPWRLPRLSELSLIQYNMAKINAAGKGFQPLLQSDYWSATEYNLRDAWSVEMESGVPNYDPKTTTHAVRCVRELPSPIMIYDSPACKLGDVVYGCTKDSYNHLYGQSNEITPNGMINGPFRPRSWDCYNFEQPYYRFQVAPSEIFVNWHDMQGTASGNNACSQNFGQGWRAPRFSELRIMFFNRLELNTIGGDFQPFNGSYYWAATEGRGGAMTDGISDRAWYISFWDDRTGHNFKYLASSVRCVKER